MLMGGDLFKRGDCPGMLMGGELFKKGVVSDSFWPAIG